MKKYELTQEQINQLAEKKHAKELLQEFIPEAFENKLEVGKVYKNKYSIFKVTDLKDDVYSGYGLENEKWLSGDFSKKFTSNDVEATEEEWLEALIKEAERRGFKNIHKLKLKNFNGDIFEKGTFSFCSNKYYTDDSNLILDGVIIMADGIWAEVIKEEIPTQEEIDRVINYLKNK